MPTFDLDENKSAFQIRSYQPGMIQVNDQKLTSSIIITPNKLITSWLPQNITELSSVSFTDIIALKPDILLIGTGSEHTFISIELYGELMNIGIGVEIMNTAAACRTYNALSAEDRNVAAALIIR